MRHTLIRRTQRDLQNPRTQITIIARCSSNLYSTVDSRQCAGDLNTRHLAPHCIICIHAPINCNILYTYGLTLLLLMNQIISTSSAYNNKKIAHKMQCSNNCVLRISWFCLYVYRHFKQGWFNSFFFCVVFERL